MKGDRFKVIFGRTWGPEVQKIDDRQWVIGMTKDLVGVNGIDPVRQCIDPFREALECDRQDQDRVVKRDRSGFFTEQNRSIESLANRANAIMPTAGCANAPTGSFVISQLLKFLHNRHTVAEGDRIVWAKTKDLIKTI